VRAASALSTHPTTATALGEAAGQVLEALGGARPALALVTVTPPHLGTLEDIGVALAALLAPDVVIGAVSSAVVGGGSHVRGVPALALFAVAGVAASPLSLMAEGGAPLRRSGGLDGATAAVVLADPFSCPGSALLDALADPPAGGGLVDAGQGPGGSRLLLDGSVRTSGAVGALLGPPCRALASQGAIPVGAPWVVTRADGDLLLELGGRPAAERGAEALGADARPAAVGLALDEQAEEPGRADLLAVSVEGAAPGGGLRLARAVQVGWVVRFLRTGPVEAEADLGAVLSQHGPAPSGVLLFPAAGRAGDAGLVTELLGCPTGGVGVSAALGPVRGAPALHGAGATGLIVFP